MSVVKRFNELLDLDEIDVLIDEVDKSRHIILSDIPDSLPQGRSSFLIETSPYMKQNTELQMDFIDSEGASIYTEPIADYLEGRARRVSVEVYDDTAPGIATLIIVGELIAVPDGNTIFSDAEQVPQRFQGAYNVRLTKQIVINPTAVNTQPIKFFGQPIINVTETRVGTMVRSEITGSITSSLFELEAVPTDENLLFKPYGVNLNPSQGLLSEGSPASPAKQRSLKAYIESRKRKNRKGKRKNSIFKRSGLLSKTNSPPSFPYRIRPGSFNGEESFRFNTGFVGGEVHFHTSSLGNTFGSSSFYPQAALTEAGLLETPTFDTEKEQGIVNTSASMYTASIVDLVSDRIIAVDKPFTNKNVNGEDIILPIFARGQIHYEAMPTASYAAANLVSYANVTLADMRTFSGDVYKVKVYVKSEGGFDDYKLLAEVPLEGKELLVDDASVGQGDRTGYFIAQSDVDNFWTVSGSVNGETPLSTPENNATYNNNVMLDSVRLSGSLADSTHNLKFQLRDQYKFELIKGVDYNLSIDVIGNRSGSNYATLAFYISGSSMNRLDNLFHDVHAGGSASSPLAQSGVDVEESSKYGKRLGTLTVTPEDDAVKDFQTVTQTFTPDATGDGVLQIRVLQGVWNIGDIAIGPAADTGFNPSLFQFKQEMPAELSHKRPDTFEFMAEFYDVNNNLSDTIAYKSGVQFTGTNMTITGEDNVLESNMFIGGDTTASGMHLGGVTSTLPETGRDGAAGSGFMRSVGYTGFISASRFGTGATEGVGKPGFMIYSGSVLPDSGDNYLGVGLELVGESGSLKFRTNPSVFDVRADAFFVGRQNIQFVSGAAGNIEISSSGVHITPEGNITASAVLLGDKSGGQFLQFDNGQLTVQGNLSVDQIFTPATINGNPSNLTNASSSITADGFANFVSASIAGFTVNPIAIHSANNNLVMSASGQITGSDVLFTGGKIASFNLSDDAFTAGNTFFISSSVTDTNGFFISSSNFNVKAGGDITGSQVLFTGGTIGGFTLNEQQITGGNLVLDKNGSIKSSNYQSDVAGFIITAEENGFAEFENVRIRGTLATTTFEKESVNAVGGQLFVANSTALTGSAILAAATTMSVVNASGFENGEILVAKKVTNTGFNTEYIRVDSASLDGDLSKEEVYGRIYVTRSISAAASENSSSIGDPIGTAQDYEPGQVLVSSGKIGTGYIRLNANPNNQATPYIDIIERTGSGVYDVQLKARLGDLKGVAGTRNVPANFDGFGLMSEVAFLSGSNIKLEAPTFLLGDLNQNFVSGSNSNIEISSSAFHLDTQNNVMNMSGSVTASKALIGTPAGPRVSFDGTNIVMSSSVFNLGSSTNFVSGSNGNIEIKSNNFHLTATGNVTMSGDLSADTGNFKDVNILGSLVRNTQGNGTLNLVETWLPAAGGLPNGNSVSGDPNQRVFKSLTGIVNNLSSNSVWGWVDSGPISAAARGNFVTTYTDASNSTQVAGGLVSNDGDGAFDPNPAIFKGTNQMEGRALDTEGTNLRIRNSFYDSLVYKTGFATDASGNINGEQPMGQQGGIPKLGISMTGVQAATGFVLTSGTIGLGLSQTDFHECNLEFASRDGGNFGGFATNLEVAILKASDDSVLYTETKTHSGSPKAWISWSIPMVTAAGLITAVPVSSISDIDDDPFTIISNIKIRLSWDDSGNSGGGAYGGVVLSEMRIRKSPYISFLTTKMVAADTFAAGVGGTSIEVDANSTTFDGTISATNFHSMNQSVSTTATPTFSSANFTNGFTAGGGTTFESYEEGTWTPFLNGDSGNTAYGTTTANYRKIGGVVFIQLGMQSINVIGTDSGDFEISNLPFTCAVTMVVGPVMSHSVDLASTASNLVAYVNTNEVIKIYQIRDNASYQILDWVTNIANGDFIFFSGFYFTDQ